MHVGPLISYNSNASGPSTPYIQVRGYPAAADIPARNKSVLRARGLEWCKAQLELCGEENA